MNGASQRSANPNRIPIPFFKHSVKVIQIAAEK